MEQVKINFIFIIQRLVIYSRLMRLDKPIGTLLLLWPTLWAILIASGGKPDNTLLICFGLGTVLMRSAGCVVNDYADRDIDGAVERTQHRPFAQGQVSKKEALILAGILSFLAALCLLPFSYQTWLLALPALFLAFSYPFTKRFFPLPQLYLGLAFSFGIPMAFMATISDVPVLAWWVFAANVFWTLAYDTIYAMADKEDDVKLGIHTSAITFGRYDAEIAMLCYGIFDILMLHIGFELQATWSYWLIFMLTVYWQWQYYLKIQARQRANCFAVFLDNNKIGWAWFCALLLHYSLSGWK